MRVREGGPSKGVIKVTAQPWILTVPEVEQHAIVSGLLFVGTSGRTNALSRSPTVFQEREPDLVVESIPFARR